ncbi:hypothetical protein LWC33_00090 [Pseudonocardia sp. RS11V-5]|uniref:hypothetical protein n=1 Tax=Pseudonocardia terrae TaxID=2905831 RepID=UPI001E462DB6|nr:hypothetical protein [Pseudonocardia terrae]MCE3549852.1 hypothetical protein [Pseudonocardia terrae]
MIEELRIQITAAQERLVAALEADEPHEAVRHRARLEDLIEIAARHDIDVSAWVDRTLLRG